MNHPDNWQPTSSLQAMQARATALGAARRFMAERHILEVETPILVAQTTTDPDIDSLRVTTASQPIWLRASPEFHMKRLLAAGAPDIYQLGKSFRADESGRLHEPEFTLLEWYRLGHNATQMAAETCQLILALATELGSPWLLAPSLSYQAAFADTVGINPFTAATADLLACCARQTGWHSELKDALADDRAALLDFIASHGVWPALPRNTLITIHDFPVEQALLARANSHDPSSAARFEVFFNGIELANGYHELQDAAEHRRRFATDNAQRRAHHRAEVAADPRLLAALDHGLPDCAGVAAGIDRIILCALGLESIAKVVSFRSGH